MLSVRAKILLRIGRTRPACFRFPFRCDGEQTSDEGGGEITGGDAMAMRMRFY